MEPATDILRAKSDLKSSEYAPPVLGLIFLGLATTTLAVMKPTSSRSPEKLKGKRTERKLSDIAIEKPG